MERFYPGGFDMFNKNTSPKYEERVALILLFYHLGYTKEKTTELMCELMKKNEQYKHITNEKLIRTELSNIKGIYNNNNKFISYACESMIKKKLCPYTSKTPQQECASKNTKLNIIKHPTSWIKIQYCN